MDPRCNVIDGYPLKTAFGRTGSLTILDDLGEGASEDPGEPDSIAEFSSEPRDEGHDDFSLIGSAKRLGAMRRAMLDQYRARTMVMPRNPRTETMPATIAVMRVLSKPAIVFCVDVMFMACVFVCILGCLSVVERVYVVTICCWLSRNNIAYCRYDGHWRYHNNDE